jgi:hypothetical protein
MFAFGHELSVALTPPDLGLPADILDDLGVCFQAPLQMSADLGGIAVRPGAFHQSPAGMGVTGFGKRTLLAPLTRGLLCREHAQEFHQFSGGIETAQVAHFSHHRDGHGEVHTAQGLKGVDHRVQTPRLHVILAFLFETLEACGVFVDGSDIFWKDDGLRWCGADHFREPPEMGRAPMGPAGVAAIVSEYESVESKLGVLKSAEGSFTGPSEVSYGFIFHFGDIDHGALTRARQPGQLPGVPAVGFDGGTGRFGNE